MFLFHEGLKNKVMASHTMNNSSSRSHTIFTLQVETYNTKTPEEDVVKSKL